MRNLKVTCQLASPLFYGLSLLIYHQALPIAIKAHNDLCSSQGVTLGEGFKFPSMVLITIAAPLLLARSNALVLINLVGGLITIGDAVSLLHTAANTPHECFTQAQTYEDRTSGIWGFEMWLTFAILLSYILLVIDLTIWGVRKLVTSRRMPSDLKQSNLIS
jgi:hypothetical protein